MLLIVQKKTNSKHAELVKLLFLAGDMRRECLSQYVIIIDYYG